MELLRLKSVMIMIFSNMGKRDRRLRYIAISSRGTYKFAIQDSQIDSLQ